MGLSFMNKISEVKGKLGTREEKIGRSRHFPGGLTQTAEGLEENKNSWGREGRPESENKAATEGGERGIA